MSLYDLGVLKSFGDVLMILMVQESRRQKVKRLVLSHIITGALVLFWSTLALFEDGE